MKREEIDVLWGNAVVESIARGDQATRYRFAEMVAAKEREAFAKACDALEDEALARFRRFGESRDEGMADGARHLSVKIRARGKE